MLHSSTKKKYKKKSTVVIANEINLYLVSSENIAFCKSLLFDEIIGGPNIFTPKSIIKQKIKTFESSLAIFPKSFIPIKNKDKGIIIIGKNNLRNWLNTRYELSVINLFEKIFMKSI